MKKLITLGLIAALLPALPPQASAQTGVLETGAVIVGIIYVAGVATYYVLQNNQGQQWTVPISRSGFPQRQPQVRPGPRPARPGIYEPRIDNPDEKGEPWYDYVWANDIWDAENQCRRIADYWGAGFVRAERANRWTNKAGKSRYTCYFDGTEGVGYGRRRDRN